MSHQVPIIANYVEKLNKIANRLPNTSRLALNRTLVILCAVVVYACPTFDCSAQINSNQTPRRRPNLITPRLQKRQSTSDQQIVPHLARPQNTVSMIINPATGSYRLIGSESDIEIVHAAIVQIENQQSESDHSYVLRVTLEFQLATVVVAILEKSLESEANGLLGLQVEAAHFPEAIVLVGPRSSVWRAERMIASIDSHPDFKKSKPKPNKKSPLK